MLNVENLFDYLKTYQNAPENNLRFLVTTGNGNKGIHMRSGRLVKPEEFNVTVEPLMFNDKFAGNRVWRKLFDFSDSLTRFRSVRED